MSIDAVCGHKLTTNKLWGTDVSMPYIFDVTISACSNWINYDNRWKFEEFIKENAVETILEKDTDVAFDVYVHTKETFKKLRELIGPESKTFEESISNVLNSKYDRFYIMFY